MPHLGLTFDLTVKRNTHRLRELEETMLSDLDEEDDDVAANRYPSPDEDDEED